MYRILGFTLLFCVLGVLFLPTTVTSTPVSTRNAATAGHKPQDAIEDPRSAAEEPQVRLAVAEEVNAEEVVLEEPVAPRRESAQ
nr:hypothetical protein [Tanacetum cinerariifolium]